MQNYGSSSQTFHQNHEKTPQFVGFPPPPPHIASHINHGFSVPPPQYFVPPPNLPHSNTTLPNVPFASFTVPPPFPPVPVAGSGFPLNVPPPNFVPFNPSAYGQQEIIQVKNPENEEDDKISNFLQRFKDCKVVGDKNEDSVTVAEYIASLKKTLTLFRELSCHKKELENHVKWDDKIWNQKIKHIVKQQNMLCDKLSQISDPKLMERILFKLCRIQKKRKQIKQRKAENKKAREINAEKCLQIHHDIDQWQDAIREKDLQQKREAEMKKEADNILSEVRKKIQEARRTLEALKKLEKGREIKNDNTIKKGIIVSPQCEEEFKIKLSEMRNGLMKQLSDYQAEETALKVMLETEHEGQRELEEEWKIKKMKLLQQKKQRLITSALFGDPVESSLNDPLFLFHQYYDTANQNLANLIEIRRSWDIYLVPPSDVEGSSIPQNWVVPSEPSNKAWAVALQSSK